MVVVLSWMVALMRIPRKGKLPRKVEKVAVPAAVVEAGAGVAAILPTVSLDAGSARAVAAESDKQHGRLVDIGEI